MANNQPAITILIHRHYLHAHEMSSLLNQIKMQSMDGNQQARLLLSLFMEVNYNPLIGYASVNIAYQNTQELLRKLKLQKKVELSFLQELQQAFVQSKVIHRSEHGFIAIDIDGTSLVEKIDKNFLYGVFNNACNVRQSLIEYMGIAQNAGFDLIILTARPGVAELGLEAFRACVGSKPTQEIIAIFEKYGLHIQGIARSTLQRKGAKMVEMLNDYKANGATDAIGILLDDQLKQVHDVLGKKQPGLYAFDVNSRAQMSQYIQTIDPHYNGDNPLHPLQITKKVIANNRTFKKIRQSARTLKQLGYPTEVGFLKQLIEDLAFRFYETSYRAYRPDINWFNETHTRIDELITKLNVQGQITHQDIKKCCALVANVSSPSQIIPNSSCEVHIKNLLESLAIIPLVADIKNKLFEYENHLESEISHNTVLAEQGTVLNKKLRVVNVLQDCLEGINSTNRAVSLTIFRDVFTHNKAILAQSRIDAHWYSEIQALLAKIPLIGFLFQAKGKQLTQEIDTLCQIGLFNHCAIASEQPKDLTRGAEANP